MATLDDFVGFFTYRVPNAGRTQIVKFLYLADHEARRHFGRPLTDLLWTWDRHGPFDKRVLASLESLRHAGRIQGRRVTFFNGNSGWQYSSPEAPDRRAFSAVEYEVVDYVARQFGDLPPARLLEDFVYQTEPMIRAQETGQRGDRLDMDCINSTASQVDGFDLEGVYRAYDQEDRGEVRPFDDVMDELLGTGHARS